MPALSFNKPLLTHPVWAVDSLRERARLHAQAGAASWRRQVPHPMVWRLSMVFRSSNCLPWEGPPGESPADSATDISSVMSDASVTQLRGV